MASDQFHAKLYQNFTTFFDKAEQERRWNPYRDVPWDRINPETPEFVATCAETFLGVESFLPDYIRKGMEAVRASSWAQRSWPVPQGGQPRPGSATQHGGGACRRGSVPRPISQSRGRPRLNTRCGRVSQNVHSQRLRTTFGTTPSSS